MSGISNVGAGIGSLLGGLGGSSALFGAISGASSSNSADGLLNAISGGKGESIDQLLQNQKVDKQRNNIMTEVANRLTYIQEGRLEPTSEWEQVSAYAMETGQPLVVGINDKGKVEAVPQGDADLSRYTPAQQAQLYEAIDQVSEISAKVRGNRENEKLIAKLEGANTVVTGIMTGALVPEAQWEHDAQRLMNTKTPFKIALNNKGELMVQDQTTADMSDLPINQQKLLRSAASGLRTAIQTGNYTQLWQAEAKSYMDSKVSIHLEIDKATNQIQVKPNEGDNVVPKFLRDVPYPDIGADAPWKETAAQMIQDNKPFFLDFDQGGQLTVKEATAPNLIRYASPRNTYSQFSAGAVMSIIA